ncbi:MAG: carboxypeptidase regulatory-like domain-containing protein [Elusimicrobia bacterium]|nr:carboxypeptidase regulatory-like domain-containing protein [Elusimicrobiota bacterium]
MRCPSCHVEYPPETHECPKCGVVLAKWHSGKPLNTPRLEGEQRSSPIILYGGLALAVLAGIYYWRAPSGAPVDTVQTQAPAPAAAAGAEVSASVQPDVSVPEGWRFEGTVFDLRTGTPVSNAQVDIKAAGKVYRTITTPEGRYRRDVPALETGGYALTITHPGYRPEYIKGSPEAMAEEFRGRMDCSKQGEGEVLSGKTGETTAADFMICPKKG